MDEVDTLHASFQMWSFSMYSFESRSVILALFFSIISVVYKTPMGY